LEKAAAIEPEDPTVQEHLGDVYLAQGKKQQAVAHYRQSLMLSDKEEAKKRLQEKIDLVK
jgi:predicted negative regulator of RcsB-dependent stress response